MADRIQHRRDTAANWAQYNPVLLDGEVGIEKDTDQWKMGDGIHQWSQLPYRGGELVQQTGQSTTVGMSQKAVTDSLKRRCATNWFGSKFILIYNSSQRTITVSPTVSDGPCYLWCEDGSIQIPYSKLSIVLNIPDATQMLYLYAIQDTVSEDPVIFLVNSKSLIPSNAIIIDVYYYWTTIYPIKAFWISDFIQHVNFPPKFAEGCVSYANPNKAIKLLYVTRLKLVTISLVYNGDTTATCTITRDGSQGYIYHEQGYFSINSNSIVSNLQLLDDLNIIYFDVVDQEVKVTNRAVVLDNNCVVLEVFYAYHAAPTYGCWTTSLISKTGFPEQDNVLSLVKPSDIKSILSSISSLSTRTTNLEQIPWNFHCATNWFGSQFKVVYDSTNDTISTVVTTQSGSCYLWHENGSIEIPLSKLNATFEIPDATQMLYLYAIQDTVSEDPVIFLTGSSATIPKGAVIIDIFYIWAGANPKAFWTSDFIPHEGFPSNYADGSVSYFNPKNMKDLQNRVSVLENIGAKRAFPYSIKAFRRVGCIGDSYTKGYIYPSGGSVTEDENYAWPHFMETFTKNKYSNWGVSGSTAKGWMSGAAKLAQVQANGNKCQAYVIGLMINDRSQAAWNRYYTPVGVITDIGTDNDTYYAWYYKLIQAVIAVNPDAPIFCNTCPRYSYSDEYNQAVRDIVEYCHDDGQKVYLNDLTNSKYSDLFSNPTFVADSVNGHYTAIGYEYMAECLKEIISDTINSNIGEFQNIHLIPFDSVE